MNECPRCTSNKIATTDNFCKVCGMDLKAAAGTTAQPVCYLCEDEAADDLEFEDGIFICYTCAQIQSELGHERDLDD